MKPEDFVGNLTVEPVSSSLVSITLSAPTHAEAVRRLETLTSIYLAFRAEQLSAQSRDPHRRHEAAHRRGAGSRER